jgi:hypothetical protein
MLTDFSIVARDLFILAKAPAWFANLGMRDESLDGLQVLACVTNLCIVAKSPFVTSKKGLPWQRWRDW